MAAGEIAQGWFWKQACLHPVNCPFSLNLTLFIPSEPEEMIINAFSWQNVNSWSSFNFLFFLLYLWMIFFSLNRNRKPPPMVLCPVVGWRSRPNFTYSESFTKILFCNFATNKNRDRRVTPKHTELQSSSHSLAITLPAISSLNPCLSIKYSWDEWQRERKRKSTHCYF